MRSRAKASECLRLRCMDPKCKFRGDQDANDDPDAANADLNDDDQEFGDFDSRDTVEDEEPDEGELALAAAEPPDAATDAVGGKFKRNLFPFASPVAVHSKVLHQVANASSLRWDHAFATSGRFSGALRRFGWCIHRVLPRLVYPPSSHNMSSGLPCLPHQTLRECDRKSKCIEQNKCFWRASCSKTNKALSKTIVSGRPLVQKTNKHSAKPMFLEGYHRTILDMTACNRMDESALRPDLPHAFNACLGTVFPSLPLTRAVSSCLG